MAGNDGERQDLRASAGRAFWKIALLYAGCAAVCWGQLGGELRFCLRSDPKTFDPLLVEDDNSEVIRYLTGGVLIRVNRVTQALVPELAASWKVDEQGRRITFHLRRNLAFSDGTPFSAADVAYTMTRLMDPNTHSATADAFRSSAAAPRVDVRPDDTVSITFGAPVAGLERLFDQVAILSSRSPQKIKAVLGPFYVADYRPGIEVVLNRNPHYWKFDGKGRRLPYLDRVRLEIQQNRDLELVKFRRGEVDLITSMDADVFDQVARQRPSSAVDAGVSLESEMMWFNEVPTAPLPEYKRAWFASQEFRRAVSEAIHRDDICRVVYKGHARPAEGPVSPANRFWFNSTLKPPRYDPDAARSRLARAGFHARNGALYDREGHAVEFSLVTNSGNRTRERIAAMIQEDLKAIGIRLNVVTLDFPSLIDRITHSFQYETCLLGFTNVDLDPNGQMNVWLSSSGEHMWNPNERTPATPWEAEIDRLMHAQASEPRPNARKKLFDRVQQIVQEQAPVLYLVNKDSLMAFSPELQNVAPAALRPEAYWNIDTLRKGAQLASRH
ncbi:MAG TPA: ABC transporter substrate-binding protein [Bryobacteraceae bacterium]|nr:ABC transporter substrate-binding protein [Bryobacteraceae bacterium]